MAACAFACRFQRYIPISSCVQNPAQQIPSSQQLGPCSVTMPVPRDAIKHECSTRRAKDSSAGCKPTALHCTRLGSASQQGRTHMGKRLWTLSSAVKQNISSTLPSSGSWTKRQVGFPGTYQLQLLHKPSIH